MYFSAALLAALPLVLAAPLVARQSTSNKFTMIAARSASPVHLRPIDFFEEGWYIGEPTQTFCPSPTVDCSGFNNNTSVMLVAEAGKPTTAAPDVVVPGGQTMYVAANGAVMYTIAHSGAIPVGAFTTGFVYTPPTAGQSFGDVSFNAGGATGFIACPVDGKPDVYQVFADVTGKNTTGCLGFDALATPYTGSPAWQYE